MNLKILLGPLVDDGQLSEQQRNGLLSEMSDAVAEQVRDASYTQTQAISLALAQAAAMVDVHGRLIRHLEQAAGLKRRLEFLPSDDAIGERRAAQQGLLAPELAVLMAYVKIHLHSTLLESELPEDPYLALDLRRYFPPPLPERFGGRMRGHRLRREIIATVVANQLVDRAGTTFAFRLGEETGAPVPMLARGYAVAREVFQMRSFWSAVEQLDNQVEAQVQLEMLIDGRRLVERATRWLVRANPREIDIEASVRRFGPGAELLARALPYELEGVDRQHYDRRLEELRGARVPDALAQRVAGMPSLLWAFDIVEIAVAHHDPAAVMTAYFRLATGARPAARPDPRVAPRHPLAGLGPSGTARRAVPIAPGVDAGGARLSGGRG